jgi:hypothetical protein
MDKRVLFAIATLILLGGAYASYLYLQRDHPRSEIGQVIDIPSSPSTRAE